jgi:glucan 1,3-beta-glucosidase
VEGPLPGTEMAKSLLDESGRIVSRARPQYERCGVNEIVSVRGEGAMGDGETVSLLLRVSACRL